MEIQNLDPIPHREKLQLDAAEGWAELGNCREALAELDQIDESLQLDPRVARMRFRFFCENNQWEKAALLMRSLAERFPVCETYLCYAQALRFHEGIESALALLQKVLPGFSDEPMMYFQLACYCSLLGRVEEAATYLSEALRIDLFYDLELLAKDNPELKALRIHLLQTGQFHKLFRDSE